MKSPRQPINISFSYEFTKKKRQVKSKFSRYSSYTLSRKQCVCQTVASYILFFNGINHSDYKQSWQANKRRWTVYMYYPFVEQLSLKHVVSGQSHSLVLPYYLKDSSIEFPHIYIFIISKISIASYISYNSRCLSSSKPKSDIKQ